MNALRLLIPSVMVFLSLNLHAFGNTDLERSSHFIKGIEAYNAGSFQDAIDQWQTILQQDATSAELHYNLGNAYFKLKNYPLALLQYKRAKLLSPWDQDILANLTLTESRADVFSADRPSWYDAALTLPQSHWRNYLVGAWWITVISFLAAWLLPRLRPIALRTGSLSLLLMLICFAPLLIWQNALAHPETVLIESSKIRFAPLDDAPVHFELPAGSSVIFKDADRNWIKVSHQNKEGWIPKSHAVKTIPLNEMPPAENP